MDNAALIVRSAQPFNAETRPEALRASFLTPQHRFYVRGHGEVPVLDENAHRIRLAGRVTAPLTLSVAELRWRFPRRSVTAVLQCAGNRRADLHAIKPVAGDPWTPGAIGNAVWTGVALADVLRAAGAATDAGTHVAFAACDEVRMSGEPPFRYGVSIPIGKAMAPEVLLAFEMNGEPLAPEHGFPVRVIVPGFAGVRSPKWLAEITVQDVPSDNHMQQRDYKLMPPDVSAETVDWDTGVTIYDMPLNAAICDPAPGAALVAGTTVVRGYATVSGRHISRVDVSADDGRTWHQAELHREPDAPWSWTFWTAELNLPAGKHRLVARAWDSAGQTQPSQPSELWNFKGYLSAAWHRVPVTVS